MRLSGKPEELFAAFSRITGKAFADDRLLSCPALSKAPNYGDVLRRFITSAPPLPASAKQRLRSALYYCLANGGHLFFLLLSRLYITLLGWQRPASMNTETLQKNGNALLVIDTFALLPGIAEKNRFQEGYLPGLYEEALGTGYTPVRLYRLYGSRHPKILWQAMKVLAKEGGITEAHLFTWSDWFTLCRHIIAYPFSLQKLIRSLKPLSPETPEASIREALIQTAGQNVLTGEARRLAGFRLGQLLALCPVCNAETSAPLTGPRVLSWYENQTVDKAFQRGLRQAEAYTQRHIPSVGAQLFIWPDTLLNNHPDAGEAALGLVPDTVLVNGSFFMPEGNTTPYAIGPSLRYGHLFTQGSSQEEHAAPVEKPLLALLSYHPDETRRVLELLLPLARKGMPIHYKFHPATRTTDYSALLPDAPVLVSGALVQALASAGAVIGAGSGSLAEAAALGVPVLAVQDPSGIAGLDLQYLPPFGQGQLWDAVRTAQDIEPALNQLLTFKKSKEHPVITAQFRDMLFTRPTPEAIHTAFGI